MTEAWAELKNKYPTIGNQIPEYELGDIDGDYQRVTCKRKVVSNGETTFCGMSYYVHKGWLDAHKSKTGSCMNCMRVSVIPPHPSKLPKGGLDEHGKEIHIHPEPMNPDKEKL